MNNDLIDDTLNKTEQGSQSNHASFRPRTSDVELGDKLDVSVDRSAMMSPTADHRNYNRFKYYSALKTGYKHLGDPTATTDFLTPPEHVIDTNLFLFMNPFASRGK